MILESIISKKYMLIRVIKILITQFYIMREGDVINDKSKKR